ncbi:glycosyltransferase family 2 protein [Actinomyces sp.]|uniref:glycosyltransferase family 2 protein n=1 Tax=Actinomyces sp. TaxID=29317 RepID=UPI0026DBE176|nr:glycosyltransferase [Actinomyces sp.]MDO4901456.1 glycosyltransferase [Actinomyces sp.]
MHATATTLDVAVCTYRRPELVAALVPRLLAQVRGLDGVDARVVIVDNDAAGSARERIVGGLADALVRVVVEPTPGLSAARNRALDEAAGRDLLVFIDDDEVPGEGWLAALVSTYRDTGAVAVTGPVESVFDAEPEPWVAAAPVFARASRASGSRLRSAATNNLLLDMAVVRRLGLRFDPRFAFTGGEDTFFTRSLTSCAGALVWCDEAVVTETVPAERANREWVLTRAQRNAETWAWVRILDVSGWQRVGRRMEFTARGAALWLVGSARALAVRGDDAARQARRSQHEHRAAGGRGILRATLLGPRTTPYAR